jgi:hypothetical protein
MIFRPISAYIKADSTVFVEDSGRTQTIISWYTNEPATSQVLYQEGVHGGRVELKDLTPVSFDYSKEHTVIINKLKPGTVYTFKVKSVDSGGNETISEAHTFMTAKKRESIFQVIMKILEDTFSWMRKLM